MPTTPHLTDAKAASQLPAVRCGVQCAVCGERCGNGQAGGEVKPSHSPKYPFPTIGNGAMNVNRQAPTVHKTAEWGREGWFVLRWRSVSDNQ